MKTLLLFMLMCLQDPDADKAAIESELAGIDADIAQLEQIVADINVLAANILLRTDSIQKVLDNYGQAPPPPPPPPGGGPQPGPGPWEPAVVDGAEWSETGGGTLTNGTVSLARGGSWLSNWVGNNLANGSIPKSKPIGRYGDRLTSGGSSRNVRWATSTSELGSGPGMLVVEGDTPITWDATNGYRGGLTVNGKATADVLYVEKMSGVEARNLLLLGVPGTRAIVKSDSSWRGGEYRDIRFIDCVLYGGYDATTDTRRTDVKWGYHTYLTAPSAIGSPYSWIISGPWGIWQGFIGKEHFLYDHVPSDWLVEKVWISDSRRCAMFFRNNRLEGSHVLGDTTGFLHVRDCRVRDVCLEDGGGGSALTFSGSQKVLVERVEVRLGARQLAPTRADNITGALVAQNQQKDVQEIEILGCDFQVGPIHVGKGSARRPNVMMQAFVVGRIGKDENGTPTRIAQAVGAADALQIGGGFTSLTLDDENEILGHINFAGQRFKDVDSDGDGWYDGKAYADFLAWAAVNEPRITIE